MAFEDTKEYINAYVRNKKWYWYVPLWLFGIYAFVAILRFDPNTPQPIALAIPQSFDFFLHEMAHIVTAFLPQILTAAAGSMSELLLGTLLIVIAFKTRGYFASLICCLWFMLACQSVGIYMADARSQKLALVSLGGALSGSDEVIHDWNFVFGKLHLLRFDILIGDTVRGIGIIVGLLGIGFTAWLMYRMADNGDQSPNLSAKESMMVEIAAAEADKPVKGQPLSSQGRTNGVYPTAYRGVLAEAPPSDESKKPENHSS